MRAIWMSFVELHEMYHGKKYYYGRNPKVIYNLAKEFSCIQCILLGKEIKQ